VIEFGEFKDLLKTNYLQDDENDYPWYFFWNIYLINSYDSHII
jgi:hypothetical protein